MTAGYSATPLAKKLGIKPSTSVALSRAPTGWFIPDLPDDVRLIKRLQQADVVICFVRSPRDMTKTVATAAPLIFPDRALWIAWPRKAGGHVSDVDENAIRHTALELGLVDVKVAAIDIDWSGLKLVWRKERR